MKTKEDLYEMYNATSTDDGFGDIETYTNWLERQLISRIEEIDKLRQANEGQQTDATAILPHVVESVCDHDFYPYTHPTAGAFEKCRKCGKLI